MSVDFAHTWLRATLIREGPRVRVTNIVKPRCFLVDAQKPHRRVRVAYFPEGSQAEDLAQEDKYAPLHFPPWRVQLRASHLLDDAIHPVPSFEPRRPSISLQLRSVFLGPFLMHQLCAQLTRPFFINRQESDIGIRRCTWSTKDCNNANRKHAAFR